MLLAIDTSIGTGVALVTPDGQVLSEYASPDPLGHLEVVGTWIRQVLADTGVTSASLTGVVAGVGPGPFTGLRVGIAAAKAAAFAANVPLLPVLSHAALALEHYLQSSSAVSAALDPITIYTDARRLELFSTRFCGLDSAGVPLIDHEPQLLPQSDELNKQKATQLSAGYLGIVACRMLAGNQKFAASQAIYLRDADVTPAKDKRLI